jgi:hypothetical protein
MNPQKDPPLAPQVCTATTMAGERINVLETCEMLVSLHAGVVCGSVSLLISRPSRWLRFTPEQALGLAGLLTIYANEAKTKAEDAQKVASREKPKINHPTF